jgi:hypothetical protein
MRVRALDSFCIGGGVDVKAGEIFEVEDARAREWQNYGHVEEVIAPPVERSSPEGSPEPAESGSGEESPPTHPEESSGALAGADPLPRHREPAPARGRKPGAARRGGRGRNAG